MRIIQTTLGIIMILLKIIEGILNKMNEIHPNNSLNDNDSSQNYRRYLKQNE